MGREKASPPPIGVCGQVLTVRERNALPHLLVWIIFAGAPRIPKAPTPSLEGTPWPSVARMSSVTLILVGPVPRATRFLNQTLTTFG